MSIIIQERIRPVEPVEVTFGNATFAATREVVGTKQGETVRPEDIAGIPGGAVNLGITARPIEPEETPPTQTKEPGHTKNGVFFPSGGFPIITEEMRAAWRERGIKNLPL